MGAVISRYILRAARIRKVKEKVLQDVEREFNEFRSEMLESSREVLFDNSQKIIFYINAYEYFIANDGINYQMAGWIDTARPIEKMWDAYLDSYDFHADTFDDLDHLFHCVYEPEKKGIAGYFCELMSAFAE